MAETDTFMTEQDLERLVSYLLSEGCSLVADSHRKSMTIDTIGTLNEFRDVREKHASALFFVISAEWSVSPLDVTGIEKDGRHVYYIRQRSGGPTLDIYAPYVFFRPGHEPLLPSGFIGFHETFWDPITRTNRRAPPALKKMYAKAVMVLRKDSTTVRIKHRRYLLASGVHDYPRGQLVLGPPLNCDPADRGRTTGID